MTREQAHASTQRPALVPQGRGAVTREALTQGKGSSLGPRRGTEPAEGAGAERESNAAKDVSSVGCDKVALGIQGRLQARRKV